MGVVEEKHTETSREATAHGNNTNCKQQLQNFALTANIHVMKRNYKCCEASVSRKSCKQITVLYNS